MQFQLLPVNKHMISLYAKPPGQERFGGCMQLLQGDSLGMMLRPIGLGNSMARSHVNQQLIQLRDMGAESLVQQGLQQLTVQLQVLHLHFVFIHH